MMNFTPMNAAAHLPAIERELDDRRREAANAALLRPLQQASHRLARPVRRALQLRAARLHGAG